MKESHFCRANTSMHIVFSHAFMHQFERLFQPTSPVNASPCFKTINDFSKLSWQGDSITSNDNILDIVMAQTAGFDNIIACLSQHQALFILASS